jgi:hypothetical protein
MQTTTGPIVLVEDDPFLREVTNLGVTGYLVKANLSLQELGDHVARLMEVER